MQTRQRVVVTGLGTLNPLGNDVETTWDKVSKGKSGIGVITQFDATNLKTGFAGEVRGFDPVQLFGRRESRRLARVSQLALAAAGQALDDANISLAETDLTRVGVIVGSGMGSLQPVVTAVNTQNERGSNRISPFFVPMMLADTPAASISITHGLRGPNMSVATACATGNNVIGEAAELIRRGAADVMVAGGTEACIIPLVIGGFSVMQAMSTRNEAPEKASRPFDKHRDGFVVSEGAAVLLLESLEHAQTRGAKIYGEILGYGSSADAHHISQPHPGGEGAMRSMQAALDDAGLAATAVDYINAHGTSTPLNDKAETAAIKQTFGDYAYGVAISSTKSMHGHLLGAVGVLEALICIKAIEANLLPPTINYETPDPNCDLDYVPNVARPADINIVMSNGFGLGGHNATLILGKQRA